MPSPTTLESHLQLLCEQHKDAADNAFWSLTGQYGFTRAQAAGFTTLVAHYQQQIRTLLAQLEASTSPVAPTGLPAAPVNPSLN